ncbi:hypothetical protein BKA62DRAFT_832009 [Auriculariales sp. MPI-PUGE-AT-0066]|nr:hypothetical protein BKA62DRAFT_832009 [Auriculariales sp. MPI-PUGE-AT-0066]
MTTILRSRAGPLPSELLNSMFGALLIATWLNTMAFTLELVQLFKYINNYNTDRGWIRGLVCAMFLVDCLGTGCTFALGYIYCVNDWGDVVAMSKMVIAFPIWDVTCGSLALMMHAFLIRRYLVLSKNWLVAGLLYIPALAAFLGSIIVAWSVGTVYKDTSDRAKNKPFLIMWLAGSLAADTAIALALLLELSRVKTSFKDTKSLILRLMRTCVLSGMLPALLAAGTLCSWLARPDANYSLIFTMPLGRVCTLTVLYNLNQRGRGYGASTNTASIPLETGIKFMGTHTDTRIGVHQISVVHADPSSKDQRNDTAFETTSCDKRKDIV